MFKENIFRSALERIGVLKTPEEKLERGKENLIAKREKLTKELQAIIPENIIEKEIEDYGKWHLLKTEPNPKSGEPEDVIYSFKGKDLITGKPITQRQGTVEERLNDYFLSFQQRYGKAEKARRKDHGPEDYKDDPETYSGAARRLLTIPEWVNKEKIKQEQEKIASLREKIKQAA